MLWIRKEWFKHEGAVDPARTVFFGHTTTTKLGDAAGEVARSETLLFDGRPAWVGVDVGAYNHVSPGLVAMDVSTFRVVKQPTLRCDRWFERINTRKNTKKNAVWKGEENLREAEVARSFGLKALASRAKKARTSTLRAQRELEEVGVVFPPQAHHDQTMGGYRIFKRAAQRAKEATLPRGPTGFRVYPKTGTMRQGTGVKGRRLTGVS